MAVRSDERWRPDDRVTRRLDYLRCYRKGRRRFGAFAAFHVHANGQKGLRVGVTASRKVGNAVTRHRLKRWVREIVRRHPRRTDMPKVDMVVHLTPRAGSASFEAFRADVHRQLGRLAETRR